MTKQIHARGWLYRLAFLHLPADQRPKGKVDGCGLLKHAGISLLKVSVLGVLYPVCLAAVVYVVGYPFVGFAMNLATLMEMSQTRPLVELIAQPHVREQLPFLTGVPMMLAFGAFAGIIAMLSDRLVGITGNSFHVLAECVRGTLRKYCPTFEVV